MGDYIVRVHAVGGHGCQREVGDGDLVTGCGQPSCPDCAARAFIKRLLEQGNQIKNASLTHWPAELPGYDPKTEVRDDLLTGKRRGRF